MGMLSLELQDGMDCRLFCTQQSRCRMFLFTQNNVKSTYFQWTDVRTAIVFSLEAHSVLQCAAEHDKRCDVHLGLLTVTGGFQLLPLLGNTYAFRCSAALIAIYCFAFVTADQGQGDLLPVQCLSWKT